MLRVQARMAEHSPAIVIQPIGTRPALLDCGGWVRPLPCCALTALGSRPRTKQSVILNQGDDIEIIVSLHDYPDFQDTRNGLIWTFACSPLWTRIRQPNPLTLSQATGAATWAGEALATLISLETPEPVLTGAPELVREPEASSGLDVALSLVSGPATLDGNVLTFSGELGAVVIRAEQPGDNNWLPAEPIERTITVAGDALFHDRFEATN